LAMLSRRKRAKAMAVS